jgi:glutathione S-transferase
MKLIYSPGSPFARKVRIVLAEKDLPFESLVVDAYEVDTLLAANPIGQVPALVLDDGSGLADSGVICAWLDAHHPEPRLIPEGEAQWPVRRLEALADAMAENTVKLRMEQMRPEAKRSAEMMERHVRKTRRGLDALETQAFGDALCMAQIALVCALDYMDFRCPEIAWREGRPALTALHARLSKRPSLMETRPG